LWIDYFWWVDCFDFRLVVFGGVAGISSKAGKLLTNKQVVKAIFQGWKNNVSYRFVGQRAALLH